MSGQMDAMSNGDTILVSCIEGQIISLGTPLLRICNQQCLIPTGWSLSKAAVQEMHLHFKQANNHNETQRTGGGGCFDVLNVTEMGFNLGHPTCSFEIHNQ